MTFTIVDNPAFQGRTPRPLQVACHDGTPFLTIRCGCGQDMHMHESQLDAVPAATTIAVRCPSCRAIHALGDEVRGAFADMRAAGWYR
jgi:hypothetical protein